MKSAWPLIILVGLCIVSLQVFITFIFTTRLGLVLSWYARYHVKQIQNDTSSIHLLFYLAGYVPTCIHVYLLQVFLKLVKIIEGIKLVYKNLIYLNLNGLIYNLHIINLINFDLVDFYFELIMYNLKWFVRKILFITKSNYFCYYMLDICSLL